MTDFELVWMGDNVGFCVNYTYIFIAKKVLIFFKKPLDTQPGV